MAKNDQPPVSIVLVTCNGIKTLPRVIERLISQTYPIQKIIQVDSSSTDGSAQIVRELLEKAGKIDLLRFESIPQAKFDHGGTRDFALSLCDELSFAAALLVQDAIPDNEEWLATLVAPLLKNDRLAATYSRIIPDPMANLCAQHDTKHDPCYSDKDWLFTKENASECHYHHVSACVRLESWREHPFTVPASGMWPARGFAEDLRWAHTVLEAGHEIRFSAMSAVRHTHDYSASQIYARSRADQVFRSRFLDARGRRLVSVPLHVLVSSSRDVLYALRHDGCKRKRAMTLIKSPAYRLAQGLGQWLGTRDSRGFRMERAT